MLKPLRLRPGDKVAAVSLSWGGPGAIPHRYEVGKRQLETEFGLQVCETPHALRDPEWLDRHPQARAEDLMGAFADPSIRGIISTIGGDDSIRLLPHLDLDVIRAHPKVYLGYSDTTVTHLACLRAGLVTFYGPSIMAGFAENAGVFPYMVESVRRTLFSSEPVGVIAPNGDGWTAEVMDWNVPENQDLRRTLRPSIPWRYFGGRRPVSGRLIGGCLEVLGWLRGTSVWPLESDFDEAILFLETSEETPAPAIVARELRALGAMGILARLSGLIVGRPGGSEVSIDQFDDYDRAVLGVVHEEAGLSDLAVVTQMDFGHTDPMFVLPYGVTAQIDPLAHTFAILESAVTD